MILEDLYGDSRPTDEVAEGKLIRHAATLVKELAHVGEGVVVHCVGGKGRTGTVLALALIELGMPPAAAAERVRRHGWPEDNAWQEAMVMDATS